MRMDEEEGEIWKNENKDNGLGMEREWVISMIKRRT